MAGFEPTKGSSVEVSSDDPGFQGAWYVATLVDVVDDSPTKKKSSSKKNRTKKKMGYLVSYDTLFEDDNMDVHLTEVVDPSFVRPLPPRNVRRKNDSEAEAEAEGGGDIEQFDVVDAFHRDGWWIGVVKKVITDGEISKYVVWFENPPEDVEFERSQLRLHVDWVDCHWQVPPKKKTPEQDLAATQTSESNNDDALSGLATPPSKAGVSCKRKSLSPKKHNGRNSKTRSSRSRNKNIMNSAEENSHGKTTGSDGNTKDMVSMMETSGSQAIHKDSVVGEEEIIIIETSEAEDGKSNNKRKRGRPTKLEVKIPNDSLEGTEQNDGRNMNSSASHEIPTDLDEQPLSLWCQRRSPLTVLKRSLCHSPCDESSGALNQQSIGNNGGTTTTTTATATATATATVTDYQQGWPFIKQSPVWETIETLGVHQKFTQKPHFSPLEKMKEDFREGLAIAHMITYWNLVHKILKFQLTDSVDIMNTTLETLVDLENHGFDVGCFRARINELVSLKSQLGEHKDQKEEAKKELEKLELNKSVVEEEMTQLEVKLQELQEKKAQTVEEITRLKSNMDLVSNKIMDCDIAFEKVAATHL